MGKNKLFTAYEVWLRNYPQPDINISEEWNIGRFASLNEANSWIATLEKCYTKEQWEGHWLYNAKFYAEPVECTSLF